MWWCGPGRCRGRHVGGQESGHGRGTGQKRGCAGLGHKVSPEVFEVLHVGVDSKKVGHTIFIKVVKKGGPVVQSSISRLRSLQIKPLKPPPSEPLTTKSPFTLSFLQVIATPP